MGDARANAPPEGASDGLQPSFDGIEELRKWWLEIEQRPLHCVVRGFGYSTCEWQQFECAGPRVMFSAPRSRVIGVW